MADDVTGTFTSNRPFACDNQAPACIEQSPIFSDRTLVMAGADLFVPIGKISSSLHSGVGANYEPWYLASAVVNAPGGRPIPPQDVPQGTPMGQMPLDMFSAHW